MNKVSSWLLVPCLTLLTLQGTDSARILAVLPYNVHSHFVVMEPLLLALHARGHHVTVVSSFPRPNPMENYREIDLSTVLPPYVSQITWDFIKAKLPNPFKAAFLFSELHMNICEKVLRNENVLALLQEEFDLFIGEMMGSDCFNYIGYKLKVPIVSWVTFTALPWVPDRVGLPDNPAYIPNCLVPYSDRMSFPQRVYSTITQLYFKTVNYLYSEIPSHRLAEEVFNSSLPTMDEINRQTALVLINSHYTIAHSRPLPPNVIEVGGINIGDGGLENDLTRYLHKAHEGVILCSFGSLVRLSSLPRPLVLTFLRVFARLRQTVLLKYEEDLPEAPPNVIVRPWLPEDAIISHPNVRAMIVHCGLATTIEAIYYAKPVVAIPFFTDQFQNAQNIVRRGGGVMVDIYNLSEEDLYQAVQAVIEDPKYTENMRKWSDTFHDRPLAPIESAVYWTEYVIKHKGAPQLRPASVDLPFYQYLLLDVVAFIVIVFIFIITSLFLILKMLCSILCGFKKVGKETKKKKHN